MDQDELAEVWCSKCAEPAERELTVTDGTSVYKAAYCGEHAWLLIAPRGQKADR